MMNKILLLITLAWLTNPCLSSPSVENELINPAWYDAEWVVVDVKTVKQYWGKYDGITAQPLKPRFYGGFKQGEFYFRHGSGYFFKGDRFNSDFVKVERYLKR